MVRMADGNGLTEGEYAPGDQIEITIPSGTSMLRYKGGSVQIQGIKKTDMQKVEKKHTIEPIEVTFAELMTDKIKGEPRKPPRKTEWCAVCNDYRPIHYL